LSATTPRRSPCALLIDLLKLKTNFETNELGDLSRVVSALG
jgi:hypothetical protein